MWKRMLCDVSDGFNPAARVLQLPFTDGVRFVDLLHKLKRCHEVVCDSSPLIQILSTLFTELQHRAFTQEHECMLLQQLYIWASSHGDCAVRVKEHAAELLGLLCHAPIRAHVVRLLSLAMEWKDEERRDLLAAYQTDAQQAQGDVVAESPVASAPASGADAARTPTLFQCAQPSSFQFIGDRMCSNDVLLLAGRLGHIIRAQGDAVAQLGEVVKEARAQYANVERPQQAADAVVHTHTTEQNLARVLEAAMVNQPQLLEGATGVGT
jgi:hypothetical protein